MSGGSHGTEDSDRNIEIWKVRMAELTARGDVLLSER